MAYKITEAARRLYDMGVSFHGFGTLDHDGVKMFDYYKADKVTSEQREKILAWCPHAQFKSASPAYAPEIRNVLICFPKAAYFRELV